VQPGAGRWYRLLSWSACASVVITLYCIGLHYDQADVGTTLSRPLATTAYLLTYLGSPLLRSAGAELSLLTGGVGVMVFALLTAWSLLRAGEGTRRLAPVWISIGLVAVGSAMMTALARAGIGLGQALSSRYVTFANLLWIAVAVLTLAWYAEHRARLRSLRLAGVAATVLVAAVLLVNEVQGGIRMYGSFRHVRKARDSLLAVKVEGSAVIVKGPATRLHPKRSYIEQGVLLLKKHRLSCFRDSG
jgi:hypothetical protein